MGSLFTNLVQKVVISRKWTENGLMLDREWTDEVAEKSVQMSTVGAMMWVKLVNFAKLVMQIFKWTKWTKWTEQIFVESAESAKSAKSIFATFATFASANFVGKASCESTVRYWEWSRISLIKPLLNPYLTLTRFRYNLDSHLSRYSLASLICLCMLTVGVGNVWGAENDTHDFSQSISQVLNNEADIPGVSLTYGPTGDYNYPVKEVRVTCVYNKTAGGATISVSVGGTAFGSPQTHNAKNTTTLIFTGAASATGTISVSASNNCTGSSGNGTFQITNVRLVEGAAIIATPHTVRFYTASGTYTDITEESAGDGVTPPVMSTPCEGWAFQGWSTSYSNSTTSTTVLSTVELSGGKYYPITNTTLYPVYTKSGGTVFTSYSKVALNGAITTGKYIVSTGTYSKNNSTPSGGSSFTPSTTANTSYELTITKYSTYFTIQLSGGNYLGAQNGTGIQSTANKASDENYQWTYNSNGIYNSNQARYMRANGTTDFRNYKTNNSYSGSTCAYLYKRNETTITYYYSYPSCCTPLGSINGSVSFTNPTTAVLTWNKMSNVADSDPYTISYRTGSAAYGTTNVGAVDLTGSKATCTITGLNCNTSYDFKIEVAADDGYCDKDTTMTGKNSGKWTITKTGSGSVTGGTFTTKISGSDVTGACSGDQIDIVATNANGYAFSSWTVGKEGGGSVTPNDATASTYFSMPADNVTVTAAFTCVAPTFSDHPKSKTDYLTTDSPTALGFTASAAGGNLTQQWQISSDNSSWSDIDGETDETYTPTISTAGTKYYRVVVSNDECDASSATSNVATITSVAPSVCKTPTFTVSEGTYTTNKSVELNCATDGATIYYTTDNSTPTTGSTKYTGAISVTQTTTIKAIAVKDGLSASLVASATYTIQCATPTFSVTAGTYVGSKSVEISTTYGTTIYYTTNGDNPTTGSTEYSSAITVGTSQTVKAIAVKTGCSNSAVGSAAYTIQCDAPTFSPAAGTYNANQTVYLSSTYGDNFYYTLDNSTPTTESTLYDSKTGISITASKTIKAIATKTGCDNSSVSSATYTMKCATPTFDVTAGTYTGAQTVTISSTTPGVSIYYTTNGATPTTSSTAYSSAITVSTNQTVKAIAIKDGWTDSDVGQAAYTIQYGVTWKVNDVALTGDALDGVSTLVTCGSKVTTLPSAPANNTLNNCANKFMGWSRHDFGTTPKTTASGQYDDLFTTAGGSTAITGATTFYAVFAEQTVTGDEGYYKVTSTGDITNDGRYLIVNETNGVVFDGSLSKLDAGENVVSATITSSSIVITKDNESTLADAEFTIDMTNKYVKSHSNKYIYQSTYSNGMSENTEATAVQSISIDGSGNFVVEGTGRNGSEPKDYVVLRFNSTTGSSNYRFRFYKGTQNLIQLYKYDSGVTTENYVTQCADNKVRVTYDFNGGTGTACTEGVTTKSASYTVCSTEPDKDYYDFAGWNDGTSTYDAGDTYNLQENTTFTAQWTPTEYTITYNLNGGTQQVTPAAPTSYTVESSAVTLPIPTKSHDRFDGWYENADLSTGGVKTTIAAGSHENKIYYAKWTARHEIKFYADDNLLATIYRATDENLQASVAGQGSKPDDPSAPSACSSKVFMGWTETWFNDETDTEPADLNDATGTRTGAKTYYAVWATRAGSPGSYTYSAYSTTCCGKSVEVDGGSPSNGTVTFDKSYAWTCNGDREIVMTIDPADGYQLHTFSVATGSGKVAAKSMSEDVALDNNSSTPQVITLTFAKDADGDYDVTATFTEMTATSWTWTKNVGGAEVTTDPIDIYVGQKVQVDVAYSPSGLLSSHTDNKAYIYDPSPWSNSNVGSPVVAGAYFTVTGTNAGSTSVVLNHKDGLTKTIYYNILALPLVHFKDLIHGETFADVTASISGDKYTVTMTGKTPTHDDLDEPGTGNSCEKTHLHLIGWIRSDYSKVADYMNGTGAAPTVSELTSAGTGYWFLPDADINVETYNGKTFYAVWAVEE